MQYQQPGQKSIQDYLYVCRHSALMERYINYTIWLFEVYLELSVYSSTVSVFLNTTTTSQYLPQPVQYHGTKQIPICFITWLYYYQFPCFITPSSSTIIIHVDFGRAWYSMPALSCSGLMRIVGPVGGNCQLSIYCISIPFSAVNGTHGGLPACQAYFIHPCTLLRNNPSKGYWLVCTLPRFWYNYQHTHV